MKYILILLSALLFSTCGVRHLPTAKALPEIVVQQDTWFALRSPQHIQGCDPPKCELLMIVSHNNASTADAVRVLCKEKQKTYTCTAPESAAAVLYVERWRR